ncbi:hypothetical protein [Agromyces laixinhei]|uniref:hypothetical protein n=1 Tax=Agromyces laixinhei TaxID=2585717 RepID=UPI0012ED3F77|nr:hypothetical protein [Agromyces laixinhei]
MAGLTGGDFANLVGRLLDAERAQAGMDGAVLTMTHRINAGDGGVDAHIRRALGTNWIPGGESAWQFKAGDLGPESCKAELRGATAALAILEKGGTYRLVLGKSITPEQATERREALEAVATERGITRFDGQFEVLNGDSLARWIEEFPAVASSPTIRGLGIIGQTFDEWSNSIVHQTAWVPSEARSRQIEALVDAIGAGDELGVHVEGVSGLGKTRLVMEALRSHDNRALVVYVPSEDQFEPASLSRLHQQGRAAVVVIDECDAKRHDVYSAMLQTGTRIRLVTISEPSTATTRAPVLLIEPFDDDALADLLLANEPGLWPEAARVIVEVASGNIDYALKCAKALIAQQSGSARQLVSPEDIRQFVVRELPGGALFLASCVLALFSRVGFDAELAPELATLADGLAVPETDLRAAAALLRDSGLLTAQGRYRSVGPHPVAIYLASRGWSEFGSRIVTGLLPLLSEDQTERLFARATEVGDRALPRVVVDQMLGVDGVLASIEAIAADRRGRMLQHLAVLAPVRVVARIDDLIATASDAQLFAAKGARRSLVWALQKLVWHSDTFELAADAMLRLASVENETYSNNSTGEWVSLFSALLPTTAATPTARLAYLKRKSISTDPRVRLIVIEAAKRALSGNDSTMISGELQGGVIVEPRGRPRTWGEVWAYQQEVIDLLRPLADDSDAEVATAALEALRDSIQDVLEIPSLREHLAVNLATLDSMQLRTVRAQLAELDSLYGRAGDDEAIVDAIAEVLALLPEETAADRVWRILHSRSWHGASSEIEAEISLALDAIPNANRTRLLLEALDEPIPTDFSVGHLLSSHADPETESKLVAHLDGPNSRALHGYLAGREESELGAFDRFVDDLDAADELRVRLTAQGPRTDRAVSRVRDLLPRLSVASGARALFFWVRDVSDEALVGDYLADWVGRIESQEDYNAVVDFVALHLHGRSEISYDLEAVVWQVVGLRTRFPVLGRQENDWSVLARRSLEQHPLELAGLLLDLIEADAIRMYSRPSEANLLRDSIELAGTPAWQEAMSRIAAPGSFRLSFAVRDWLAIVVPIEVAAAWVDGSVERARVLASVTPVGSEVQSPVVRYLLDGFGSDERVPSILVGHFTSGFWTGNESSRIETQIAQVDGWLRDQTATEAERRWCRSLIENLRGRLERVLQEEEEEEW